MRRICRAEGVLNWWPETPQCPGPSPRNVARDSNTELQSRVDLICHSSQPWTLGALRRSCGWALHSSSIATRRDSLLKLKIGRLVGRRHWQVISCWWWELGTWTSARCFHKLILTSPALPVQYGTGSVRKSRSFRLGSLSSLTSRISAYFASHIL
jgi:hypothetical protein